MTRMVPRNRREDLRTMTRGNVTRNKQRKRRKSTRSCWRAAHDLCAFKGMSEGRTTAFPTVSPCTVDERILLNMPTVQ